MNLLQCMGHPKLAMLRRVCTTGHNYRIIVSITATSAKFQTFMCSGELRMAQVHLSDRIWCQLMAFKALYCSCATVLVITNVIIVNNFVDNINNKYIVAMATSHSLQTWHTHETSLTIFHEMRKVKKRSTSFILKSGYLCEVVYHIPRE